MIRAFGFRLHRRFADREDDEMPGQQLRHLPLDAKFINPT